MSGEEILEEVAGYSARYVTVTGGEPLAQENCHDLLGILCDAGLQVSLETSGALDIAKVDPRVSRVMDLKTPGSGEMERNRYENIGLLRPPDQIKFVLCDHADYEWAKKMLSRFRLTERHEVLFTPAAGGLDAMRLADWILADRLLVRMQIQLHKFLWGDTPGR